jgi:hypothetical protein
MAFQRIPDMCHAGGARNDSSSQGLSEENTSPLKLSPQTCENAHLAIYFEVGQGFHIKKSRIRNKLVNTI